MAYFFLQCDCILPAVATPGWAEGGDDATDDEDDSGADSMTETSNSQVTLT